RSLPLATMTDVALTERGDGSGAIAFSPEGLRFASGFAGPPAFVMIKDARRIYDLICETRVNIFAPPARELPARRWNLPAPESAVLLWGPEIDDRRMLRLALWELIARGTLTVVESRRVGWREPSVAPARGFGGVPTDGRSLRVVL